MISSRLLPAHGSKLVALLENDKLPESDRPRIVQQISLYEEWILAMNSCQFKGDKLLERQVELLNEYKKSVELDLIFDSKHDFLYRQKGQLKLENSILEEFLPKLFDVRLVPGLKRIKGFECSSGSNFAGLSFDSPLAPLPDGGVRIKSKAQDFSITKKYRIQIEQTGTEADIVSEYIHVSAFTAEIKTNLDKTMFQEAAATAADLKKAVTSSRYFLLCEWLDMAPVSTNLTSIDEVIILRKGKRIGSDARADFSALSGRVAGREWFKSHLDQYPLNIDRFHRFVYHLNRSFSNGSDDALSNAVERGYF